MVHVGIHLFQVDKKKMAKCPNPSPPAGNPGYLLWKERLEWRKEELRNSLSRSLKSLSRSLRAVALHQPTSPRWEATILDRAKSAYPGWRALGSDIQRFQGQVQLFWFALIEDRAMCPESEGILYTFADSQAICTICPKEQSMLSVVSAMQKARWMDCTSKVTSFLPKSEACCVFNLMDIICITRFIWKQPMIAIVWFSMWGFVSPCSRHSGRSFLRVQGNPLCFEIEWVNGWLS